jgi:hypothetical protein
VSLARSKHVILPTTRNGVTLTFPVTETGPPLSSWVKVMVPETLESPLRTAIAWRVQSGIYGRMRH